MPDRFTDQPTQALPVTRWSGLDRDRRVRHMCPTTAGGLTSCCARSVYDIPRIDILTVDPDRVSCAGPPVGAVDFAGSRDYCDPRRPWVEPRPDGWCEDRHPSTLTDHDGVD